MYFGVCLMYICIMKRILKYYIYVVMSFGGLLKKNWFESNNVNIYVFKNCKFIILCINLDWYVVEL